MEPTLLLGDYVMATAISEPKRGDLVSYRLPKDRSTIYLKRIVGLAVGNGVGPEALEREVVRDLLQVELHGHAGRLEAVVDLADLAGPFQHEPDVEVRRIHGRG